MPHGEEQLSPTGLAHFQQAAQRPSGYISPGDRRLIEEGVRTGGGYIQVNDQVLMDKPTQYTELSDAGKAYLTWRGTDPKLAGIEAEQAHIRSTQKELIARSAAENALQLVQKEYSRGTMSQEEYAKAQQQILHEFGNNKAPSPIDYLSTAEDKDDPIMQETRYKKNLQGTLERMELAPEDAEFISGLTQRNEKGRLENPYAMELFMTKMKERLAGTATQKDQLKMRLQSIDDAFDTIESPNEVQQYGRIVKRNKVLAEFGLPPEETPAIQESTGWLGGTSRSPQGVAEMFEAETARALQGGQAPQPATLFQTPNPGPIRVRTNEDVRREIVKARQDGRKSIQITGPDGVTRNIPVQ
jgi:hypothetical protein